MHYIQIQAIRQIISEFMNSRAVTTIVKMIGLSMTNRLEVKRVPKKIDQPKKRTVQLN